MIEFDDIRRRLADPATRTRAAVEAGDWARDLCLMFGASIDTAFAVGGALARGLEKSWNGEVADANATRALSSQLGRRGRRAQRSG